MHANKTRTKMTPWSISKLHTAMVEDERLIPILIDCHTVGMFSFLKFGTLTEH